MKTLLEPLGELNEYVEAKASLAKKRTPLQLAGCIDSQKCHVICGLGEEYPYRVIVTYSEQKAKEIYEDCKLYGQEVLLYPAKDVIFYSADIHGNAIVRERLRILRRLIEKKPATVVMTLDGGMDRLLPLEFLARRMLILREAEIIDLEQLKKDLLQLGYERCGQVEGTGQFAVRGGIIDIFPLTEECPYRIELWDDEIDTIRSFDLESQRSIETVGELSVYPVTEIIMDEAALNKGLQAIEKDKEAYVAKLRKEGKLDELRRIKEIVGEFKESIDIYSGSMGLESYIRYFYDNTVSFFDYFTEENAVFFLDEPLRIVEKGEAVEMEFRESMLGRIEKGYILPGQMAAIFSYKEAFAKLLAQRLVLLNTMELKSKEFSPREQYSFTVKSVYPYNNNFEMLVKDLERFQQKGYRVLLFSGSRTRAARLSEDLREYGLNAFYSDNTQQTLQGGQTMVTYGSLHRGFEYPLIKLVVISESDIFGAKKQKRRKKKLANEGARIHSFTDLSIGDYVIHENHGVGIYQGIEKIEVDGVVKDYVKIEYGCGGSLYILATGLEVLQKYASAEAKKPKLHKLDSLEWKKTKTKVRGAVKEIAKELVELYAARQAKQGYQFSPDTVWQKEFEEAFPYEETEDQLSAIEAAKRDMESPKIMDRLVCGDVGYGKTEIAIRAAFKAVLDGKQVVFLVPTTILAQQHYNTFSQRMMDFPVNVDVLSRFRTPAEQKKTLERLKDGRLDILIGTHRVLSKDVAFKNLGLLVVDEEQRFGVTHKEKIKQMKKDVDVLTLSATPIPRTLHMSLVGIRDMSVLEEPPVDRVPIQTYVMEHNDEIIREAINRELARGGQVYYVHNRVNNIAEVAAAVAKLLPEASVVFAHGQMTGRELEKIMFRFINGEIDVLVSTTIIETGLDISNVNTMIIDDADRMGLAQLYQLRGRVGRSNRNAYAFLMYKRDKMLKEVAEKRLQAIREFTELGSGFKIAMRDLEIRGAGNLLGAKQHGHMEAIGYELYCKMLNDAIKALKGEEVMDGEFETNVDIDLDAYIPPSYMKSESLKLDMYKRIASIETEEEFMDMQEELVDRFGELPAAVNNLLNIAFIKALAHKAYITQIIHRGYQVRILMYNRAAVDINRIPKLLEEHQGALRFFPGANPYFVYDLAYKNKNYKLRADDLFERLRGLMQGVARLLEGGQE